MEEQSLSISFSDSLTEEVSGIAGEYVELGLDALVEDGLFKDIPIVSTAVAVYRIGKSIRERHHIAKLISFLNEFNKGIADEEKRAKYRQKFISNEAFRNQELEYILLLTDRYISFDKPQMLAKLYLSYLDDEIIWQEFTMYAEVIDRFLMLDCNTLTGDAEKIIVPRNIGGESVLRLVALGLMIEITETSAFVRGNNGNIGLSMEGLKKATSRNRTYKRTEFGEKLANILRSRCHKLNIASIYITTPWIDIDPGLQFFDEFICFLHKADAQSDIFNNTIVSSGCHTFKLLINRSRKNLSAQTLDVLFSKAKKKRLDIPNVPFSLYIIFVIGQSGVNFSNPTSI